MSSSKQPDGTMTGYRARSLWQRGAAEQAAPLTDLETDWRGDVCVIGAGIAGMSAAYELAREGLEVVVLEAAAVGGGNTSRTTAHLSSVLDDRFSTLEQLRGEEAARLAAESHQAAIAEIARICEAEGVECGFERLDGYLFSGAGESPELLEREYAAAQRAGLRPEMVLRAPLAFDTGPTLRFPDQAQFQPLAYLRGLRRALEAAGARLGRARVQDIENRDGGVRVTVESGRTVEAGAVVVATNTPINDRFALHTKQSPYLSYVVALEVERGAVPPALYWDTEDPYHYVRLAPGEQQDLLIVGGEDHKTGQAQDMAERYQRLEDWAKVRFPVGSRRLEWSGQVYETLDGLGYIGRNPGDERVYVATGDSGMGMTHGALAGLLLRDLILGRDNPWEALYAPERKVLRSAGEFARENANVLAQYRDWVQPGDLARPEELAAGTGAVMRRGLKPLALYRDEQGTLHERSAICPHLGCVVRWNADEASWDCPCHGSRFDPVGRTLNGPSHRDLQEVDGDD